MIEGLVAGQLHGRAESRVDRLGKPFVVAKVLAAVSDGGTAIVNVIAFDASTGAALTALDDGDAVALTGSMTPRVWTDKQGNARPALDMVAQRFLVLGAAGALTSA